MGPVVDNNEAMRCEYISIILHTAVSLDGLIISPQLSIIGKQNRPGKGVAQNLMQCQSSCEKEKRKADVAFDSEYEYVYDVLKDSTELRKNVKDRVTANEEPATEKRRVEEKIKKK
ncbi:428_t:CDS:2 [Ambispora leptoticha]|uniref:428_t:CDS:1 n=1 Tax=Ambispora leptoticha TaxID=144679 RepID=A0A9N8WJT3_9GLOM|nr:428_t:CDS:2 [Ambispora leptoticha]